MRFALLSLTLVLAAPALLPGASAQTRWSWPEKAENLKVLPPDTPPDKLRAIMTGFAGALGVRCVHCHVGEPEAPLSELDFTSDENPNKDVARLMYRMLGDINDEWLSQVTPAEGEKPVNMWCHTCHHGQPRPLKLEEKLSEVYAAEGVEATVAGYHDLREQFHGSDTYSFREGALNTLGYEILQAGHAADAVVIFRMNAEQFPESGNAWDSLGEAHAAAGDREQAIACYEKAVAIEPRNRNAAEQLEKLRAGE
jgi:tetratricopeptide (TPR) repeat protein